MAPATPDLYVSILNIYVENLCAVADAAWLQRRLDRYAYRQRILQHVSPALRMVEAFTAWSEAG